MDYRFALKETMYRFELRVTDLSERAEVKKDQLSAFRTGRRDLYVATLERIVSSMPPPAQIYFYSLLAHAAMGGCILGCKIPGNFSLCGFCCSFTPPPERAKRC